MLYMFNAVAYDKHRSLQQRSRDLQGRISELIRVMGSGGSSSSSGDSPSSLPLSPDQSED